MLYTDNHDLASILFYMSNLENFNFIFEQIEKKNTNVQHALGKHVHWGYWPTPQSTPLPFEKAAENLVVKLCQVAQIQNNQSVLDVGCGFGGTIDYLNQQHSELTLTGLNIDQRQLSVAEKNIYAAHGNKINFVLDDACHMKNITHTYDSIIAVESIFYFASRKRFFEVALSHLNEGGSITISDFIISPFLIPSCKLFNIFNIKALHPFGELHFITLKKYYELSKNFNLNIEVTDINHNTLATYKALHDLMSEFGFNKLKVFLWRRGLSLLKYLSLLDLNRYLILKFTRAS